MARVVAALGATRSDVEPQLSRAAVVNDGQDSISRRFGGPHAQDIGVPCGGCRCCDRRCPGGCVLRPDAVAAVGAAELWTEYRQSERRDNERAWRPHVMRQ